MKIRRFGIVVALLLGFVSAQASAWDAWDRFKEIGFRDSRVVDFNDKREITTSEGQSYALFFSLVTGDKESFAKILAWSENNLAGGDLGARLPAWLWGKDNDAWKVLDSNNAVDSDMWIAYCLLEAGRLWNEPAYTEKARRMLALLKGLVREVKGIGQVVLPGRAGFENNGVLTFNPSYYPLFILRRFALEDPSWNAVLKGTLKMLLVSSPGGFAPDWVTFDSEGILLKGNSAESGTGSYDAIRVYLWAGMMSRADWAATVLRKQFEPMVKLTGRMNVPPEKVNVNTLKTTGAGPDAFGACLLSLLENNRDKDMLRTVLLNTPLRRETYYRNMLMLFGLGFDEKLFAFDEQGRFLPGSPADGSR